MESCQQDYKEMMIYINNGLIISLIFFQLFFVLFSKEIIVNLVIQQYLSNTVL